MDTLILTKVRLPPETPALVSRPRLVTRLEQDVAQHKVVLVTAPAGFGKTTLLVQWARRRPAATGWLSLSAAENDRDRFFRSLLLAWNEVQPGVADSPLGVLLSGIAPAPDLVLSAFVNLAAASSIPTVLVLDDLQAIDEPEVYQALAQLIDHLPPAMRLVLAGRSEPPMPLARYRARQDLLELGAEDLRFSVDETADFLNLRVGLDLSQDEIASLDAKLEGWIAGIQLASLTLRRHPEATDTLVVSGRHRFVADYLSEDVLAHLPGDVQRFLLQTSILDRLCGALCDVVTGGHGGQEMLEFLDREHLFLVPLDDSREWFRYHRLFADFLREALRRQHPDGVAGLHRRAARWYLAQDLPEQAFRHAVAGEDLEQVFTITDLYLAPKLFSGEVNVAERWLASLPEDWFDSHPMLGLARVTFLLITGAVEAAGRRLDEAEQTLRLAKSDDLPRQLAKVAGFRCAIACFQNDLVRAEMYAERVLRVHHGDADQSLLATTYHALGDTYRRNGRWGDATACYLKALDVSPDPAARVRLAHVFGALADLELRRGRLRDAAGYWRKALAAVQERRNWGRLPLPVTGWIYLRGGELLYERNDLAGAWDHLSRGLERVELGGDVRALVAGYLLAGRLKLAEGDPTAATDFLERARPLVEQSPFPEWVSRFERLQIDLWLAQGQPALAAEWVNAILESDVLAGRPESEGTRLAIAHVLVVQGDEGARQRGLELLDGLLRLARTEDRLGIEIEALAILALAHGRSGDQARAMIALEQALRLAEPEEYDRTFLDCGAAMIGLLQAARQRGVHVDYVSRLLADTAPPGPAAGLTEPLSRRERKVLTLIAAGLTNREIAAQLSISAETVKKHSSSIFGKLGVANRTEAAAKGRTLDLLA